MLIRLTPNAPVVSMGNMMQNTPDVSNEVSLRYGVNGRTVHLSRNVVIGGVPVSFCNTEVRHYFGGGTYTGANGQPVYGTRTVKFCKRCVHPNQAAVIDGIVAFVLWAVSWEAVMAADPAPIPAVHKSEGPGDTHAPCGVRIARVLGEDYEIAPSSTGEEGRRPVTCRDCLRALNARPPFRAPSVTPYTEQALASIPTHVLRGATAAKRAADRAARKGRWPVSTFAKLTPFRASILRLAQADGAISADDIARDCGRNGIKRAAIKQLRALTDLGLLTPIRISEYRLTAAGQMWLDNARALAGS